VGGRRLSLWFWLEIPCDTVRCLDATASSFVAKVQGEIFAHIEAVAVKRSQWCAELAVLSCQDELFAKNPLDEKDNDEHALDLSVFHPSRPLLVCPEPRMPLKHPCTAHAFILGRLYNHFQGLIGTFSEIGTNSMLFLCPIHREIASYLIHECK
jgi:hypothetical protein